MLSSTRSTSTWSTNLPNHEPFNKPRRNKDKEIKMQEHTGLGQGTFSVCSGLFKAMENGLLTLDNSPCWKMGISLHERTRRATSMVRRGNLLLFLSFRRWRLKIQHANFATEQKYGKRICEMKIWLQKGKEVSLFKQYLTAIHLQSPLTLCMPLTSSLRIWRHLKNHKGTQNEKRPSHNQVPKIQKKKRGGKDSHHWQSNCQSPSAKFPKNAWRVSTNGAWVTNEEI